VVNVDVREDHGIEPSNINVRKCRIEIRSSIALNQPQIHKHTAVTCVDQRAAARDLTGSAKQCGSHTHASKAKSVMVAINSRWGGLLGFTCMSLCIGILVVSDRAAAGEYVDRGGPAVQSWLEQRLSMPFDVDLEVVPDEGDAIEASLVRLCDTRGCALVLTTGGTGPAPRDITPDVTQRVCDRMLPGFGEAMRLASLKVVPTAVLSRQEAGHRGASLIINLPGNPSAVADCLNAVFDAVPWCIELLGGPRLITTPEAWRPKHASP
jgi:molybdopterin adenylyltransferase